MGAENTNSSPLVCAMDMSRFLALLERVPEYSQQVVLDSFAAELELLFELKEARRDEARKRQFERRVLVADEYWSNEL